MAVLINNGQDQVIHKSGSSGSGGGTNIPGTIVTNGTAFQQYQLPQAATSAGTNMMPSSFIGDSTGNIMSLRNSTNAETLRVYNTYTDTSNGEWGTENWVDTANTLTIGTKKNGTGSARPINFVTGGTNAMTLAENGNVGIGTTSPAVKLDVVGNAKILASSGATLTLQNQGSYNNVVFQANNIIGSPVVTITGLGTTFNGTVSMGAISGTGLTVTGTSFNAVNSQWKDAGNNPMVTILDSASGSSSIATGIMGIGTTTPSSSLTIQSASGITPFLVLNSTGTGLMKILENGNVGIGTNAPSEKLEVLGNIKVSGNLQGSGFGSTSTAAAVTIAATGWTNTYGFNAHVLLEGTAMTFVIYNSVNTPVYTNAAVIANATVPLPKDGAVVITAGTGVSGRAVPW